ncbi:MAG: hypothetical protein J6B50_03810 [Lachnospiraceae bacterium]|nr:hypothetical protein [Lachnospiraceae bacterium]
MKNFIMRIGTTEQDKKIEKILSRHDGFSNATAYVKAAVLEYHNRHYLTQELIHNDSEVKEEAVHGEQATSEEKELLDFLMADMDADSVHSEQNSVEEIIKEIKQIPQDEEFVMTVNF